MTAPFNTAAFSCVILGDQSLTIACGDMIIAGGHSVAAVVTTDGDVRGWAEAQGISVLAKPADLVGARLAPFDWLLSIANLRIIPEAALALPTKGAVNFHDGPLPHYAGLNTPAWAIINGEAQHRLCMSLPSAFQASLESLWALPACARSSVYCQM